MHQPQFHIFAFTPETLGAWCVERGMPKFRGKQVLEWVYEKGIVDPAKMTNLSQRDREVLAKEMTFLSGEVVREQVATDGTRKLLIQWRDAGGQGSRAAGERAEPGTESRSALTQYAERGTQGLDPSRQTECVMIPSRPSEEDADPSERRAARATACISSQVGCPVGCAFCASGLGGLDANLSAGRIVEQVWRLDRLLKEERGAGEQRSRGAGAETEQGSADFASGGSPAGAAGPPKPHRITNVVFMGMGEPLANMRAVLGAIRTIAALWGMGISARKITVSTVGLPKAIERFAEECELPVTLALSLHAPTDEIRRRLIPWAEFSTIRDLLAACQKWFEKTGREITLEYTLLRGVNDRPEHAEELARLARTLRANVNLIRYNEVEGLPFKRPLTEDVQGFQRVLRERGVNAHIRRSRGRDIAAACGQLRHEAKEHSARAEGGVESPRGDRM